MAEKLPAPASVSVVIPTYNRAAMVRRCVASVLSSEGVDLECIVVDDHSPDNTGDVLRDAFGADPRFRYLRLPRNSRQSVARNAGARAAKGDALLFLDDDNIVAPDMAANLAAALRDHPRLGLVAPVSIHALPDGRRLVWTLGSDFHRWTSQPRDRSPRCPEADIPPSVSAAGEATLLPTTYSPNAFCVPRTVFRQVGGFDEAFGQIFEESDFGWLASGSEAAIMTAARTDHLGYLEPGCVPALRALGIEKADRTWFFARNRLWFARRHFPWWGRLSVALVFAPLSALWYGTVALRAHRPGIALAYLRGTLRGIASRLPPAPAPILLPDREDPARGAPLASGWPKRQ